MVKNCLACENLKKTCDLHRRENRERVAKHRAKYKKPSFGQLINKRKHALKSKYGLTPQEFEELMQKSNFKCCICGFSQTEFNRFFPCVDHSHQTNRIRGILCGNCNRGLGAFKDDIYRLQKAINYLSSNISQRIA